MPRRVFITVAERSADGHAANLARALRQLDPTIEIHALGGDALRAAGATVHHETVSRAAMGLAAFKRYREVKRLLAWTADFYRKTPPDLHICCDSWSMNVHFARLAKSFNTKVFYYIAPQAWASRERRVLELARLSDRVGSILPFEEKFLRERGVDATFVGHPLFDELAPIATRSAVDARSSPFPKIALPCGSRSGIARANFPRQLAVARQIREAFPQASFVVPTTPATHHIVERAIARLDWVTAHLDAFDETVAGCDLAITVSGTATLHIAAHNVPMIVVYHGSPILWHGIGRWIIKIRTFAIVNLLASDGRDEPTRHVVPEFIPWYGSVNAVAERAIEMLRHPEQLAAQKAQLRSVIERLNKPGASLNAARLAMELMPQTMPSS